MTRLSSHGTRRRHPGLFLRQFGNLHAGLCGDMLKAYGLVNCGMNGVNQRVSRHFCALFCSRSQRHAAENLVDVVARIFAAVVDGRRSITLRKILRQWRSWYMLRVSVQLHNRQRLRNW